MSAAALAVGVDTVSVDDVRHSIDTWGARYLDRVFTAHEQQACAGAPDVRARALAARFAAKEATLKALRCADLAGPWTAIEIVRRPGGWTDVELHGAAAAHAERAGVQDVSVSVTHDGDRATAVAVAVSPACGRPVDAPHHRTAEPEQGEPPCPTT